MLRTHVAVVAGVFTALAVRHANAESIIGQGTRAWAQAAYTGRADMLVIGDSTVNHGQWGWTRGIAMALSDTVGLAGTGMIGLGQPGIYPGRGGGRMLMGSGWRTPAGFAHGGVANFAMGNDVLKADGEQPGSMLMGLNLSTPELMDLDAAYDWELVVATGEGTGTLGASRYARTDDPWSRTLIQTTSSIEVGPMGNGVQRVILPFDGTSPEHADVDWHEFALEGASDITILNQRLIARDMTGATISGWGYSGFPTRDFVTDLWDNGQFDRAGRASYLSSMVAGNSGKLNVVIIEGINDSGERDPSLTLGITPGHAPEAFADNIMTLIELMRGDWSSAGLHQDNLSFTLVSGYQPDPDELGIERFNRMASYRGVLEDLANNDPAVSFVDVWSLGPDHAQSIDNGWLQPDGIHPSPTGVGVFGRVFVNELLEVPEPRWSWFVLLVLGLWRAGRGARTPMG